MSNATERAGKRVPQFLSQAFGNKGPIRRLAYQPDGQGLVAAADGAITVWNVEKMEQKTGLHYREYHSLIATGKLFGSLPVAWARILSCGAHLPPENRRTMSLGSGNISSMTLKHLNGLTRGVVSPRLPSRRTIDSLQLPNKP